MLKENGFTYKFMVLIIIIVIAIAGVVINKVVGRNGMITQVTEVENKYSKADVLEKINYKITQKFIELNNTAKENNQKISDLYNTEVILQFLKDNEIIQDESENVYIINTEKLYDDNSNISIIGKFKLEKVNDKYYVVFYDKGDNREEIGELQIQQM